MPVALVWHECRHGVGRRPRLLRRAFLVSLLLGPLVSVACGELAGPAPGDVYRLDATARAVYDCAPGSAEAVDRTICGSRLDTVDLGGHGRLSGRLEITKVDSIGDRRRTGTGVGSDGTWPNALTLEGEVTEEVCTSDCTVAVGRRLVGVQRERAVCTPTTTLDPCDGRPGDTVVGVTVLVHDMDPAFGLLLSGVEIEPGRTEGDYVRFGYFLSPISPPPRHGTRYHLSLVRERHYLGG